MSKYIHQQQNKINDLEVKIEELKAENERLKEENKVGEFWHSAYQGKQLEYDIVYAELRKTFDELANLQQQLKDNTKQVCEKIREWIKNQIVYCGGKATEIDILTANASNQVLEDLKQFLDQIEKGEK